MLPIYNFSLTKASFRRYKIKMPFQLRWKGICDPVRIISMILSLWPYPKPLHAFGVWDIFIFSLTKASFRRYKIKMPFQLRWKGICDPVRIQT